VKDAGKKLVVEAQTRAHPHNIYLHIWYELGVIGVLTFALLGLSLLLKTDQLPKRSRIFAIGHFAICMTVIAFTYGLWQNWFQAAIVLSTLALVLVARSGVAPAPASSPVDDGPPVA
jgi:O-antigen ligase